MGRHLAALTLSPAPTAILAAQEAQNTPQDKTHPTIPLGLEVPK